MSIRRLKLCGDERNFDGIQAILEDGNELTLPLSFYGAATQCLDFHIPEGSFITKVLFTYNHVGINYISFTTEQNISFQMGWFRPDDD